MEVGSLLYALDVTLFFVDLPSQRNPWYCAWQWHLKPLSVSTQSPPCWQGLGLQWSSSEGWKVSTIDLGHKVSWICLVCGSVDFIFTLGSVSTNGYIGDMTAYLLTVTVCSFVPWQTDALKAIITLNALCSILTHIWLTAVTHWNTKLF